MDLGTIRIKGENQTVNICGRLEVSQLLLLEGQPARLADWIRSATPMDYRLMSGL